MRKASLPGVEQGRWSNDRTVWLDRKDGPDAYAHRIIAVWLGVRWRNAAQERQMRRRQCASERASAAHRESHRRRGAREAAEAGGRHPTKRKEEWVHQEERTVERPKEDVVALCPDGGRRSQHSLPLTVASGTSVLA